MGKFKIKVLLGEDACKQYNNGASVKRAAEQGEIITRTFDTDECRYAYILGLSDMCGWQDYMVLKEWETKK